MLRRYIHYNLDAEYEDALDRQDSKCYTRIRKNLNRKIKNDGIFYFGSRIMGISFEDSDLDIYINIGNDL